MNILVTGGAGYIGSHICKQLASEGHTPVTLDNLSRGFQRLVKWGPLVEASVHDHAKTLETLKNHPIDAVIHCAAYAYIKESVDQPQLYMENNLYGTLLLLEAMKDAQIKNLVFSSTCAVYGEALQLPITEGHPTKPINPYGLSKLLAEQLIETYGKNYGINTVSLRYFNAAGADPEGETGEFHDPEPHLIPNLIKAAIDGTPFELNGNDYPTSDGTCIRDFIHVSDLARAHSAALENLVSNKLTHPHYNLGTGNGYSLKEIIKAVENQTGKTIHVKNKERRPGDPAQLTASSESFSKVTGWHPKLSSLESIIKTAIRN